jgi:hypothetical protein
VKLAVTRGLKKVNVNVVSHAGTQMIDQIDLGVGGSSPSCCPATFQFFRITTLTCLSLDLYSNAGRSDLPPKVSGWAKSSLLKIFLSCETANTDMCLSDPNNDTWSDPSETTKRSGERPAFTRFKAARIGDKRRYIFSNLAIDALFGMD